MVWGPPKTNVKLLLGKKSDFLSTLLGVESRIGRKLLKHAA